MNPNVPEQGEVVVDCFLPSGAPIDSKAWNAAVIDRTMSLPPASGACELEIQFVAPAERDRFDPSSGLGVDRLLPRLLQALGETLLRGEGPMDDGVEIVAVNATKRIASSREEAGIRIVVRRFRAKR